MEREKCVCLENLLPHINVFSWREYSVSNEEGFCFYEDSCTFPTWGPKSRVEGKGTGWIMESIKSVHGGCNLVLSHFASKDLSVYFQGLHAFGWVAEWT